MKQYLLFNDTANERDILWRLRKYENALLSAFYSVLKQKIKERSKR